MNCENAKVVSLEPDFVWLESIQQSACTACSAKSACGQGLLNSIFQSKRHYFKVSTIGFNEKLQIGDEVEISVDEHVLSLGALAVYGLPLLTMIGGALFASSLQQSSDAYALTGAFLGFVLGLLMLSVINYTQRNNPKIYPKLQRLVKRQQAIADVVVVKPH
jgi:sigma-E factor negative regulatory protein RseC